MRHLPPKRRRCRARGSARAPGSSRTTRWRGCAKRSSTGKKTLGEVYGAPLYGIKTGFNEAFIIDQETRDRLVKQDRKSAKLLKPFLRGENIKRWRVEPEGLFLINTPKGKVDIDDYPAIRDWLLPFKPELEKRATKQEWLELQQAQLAYQPAFAKPKVIWPSIYGPCQNPFALKRSGLSSHANTCIFHCRSSDHALAVILELQACFGSFYHRLTNVRARRLSALAATAFGRTDCRFPQCTRSNGRQLSQS